MEVVITIGGNNTLITTPGGEYGQLVLCAVLINFRRTTSVY